MKILVLLLKIMDYSWMLIFSGHLADFRIPKLYRTVFFFILKGVQDGAMLETLHALVQY